MSQLGSQEIRLLSQVADELREVFSERGYRVDVAMDADPSFGSGWSRAALTRDLVVDAVSVAASRVGVDFRPINGIGRELRFLSADVDRRYRVRRGRRRSSGGLLIQASSDSALASVERSLFDTEQWAFVWTLSPDGLIGEVLVAEVTGYVDGSPGHLELGRMVALGASGAYGGEFLPADEGLDGYEDEEGFDSDTVAT